MLYNFEVIIITNHRDLSFVPEYYISYHIHNNRQYHNHIDVMIIMSYKPCHNTLLIVMNNSLVFKLYMYNVYYIGINVIIGGNKHENVLE